MKREEHYIDQLFQDHFEDFSKSPSDEVWDGVVKHGAMANGKPFALPGGWKSGLTLLSCMLLCLVLLSGSDASLVAEVPSNQQLIALADAVVTAKEMNMPSVAQLIPDTATTKKVKKTKVPENGTFIYSSTITEQRSIENTAAIKKPVPKERVTASTGFRVDEILNITQFPALKTLSDSASNDLSNKDRRNLKRDLFATTYYKKPKGGHWFVSGGLVLDSRFGNGNGIEHGLAFGAGKYLDKNSFLEIALRGIWSEGFSMRATYTHMLLPGKFRPFVHAGLAWDYDLDIRTGVGVMYQPSPLKKWNIYASVNYEKSSHLLDRNSSIRPVFELGMQLRLSGTEPLLSDNNWMNSVPHYKVPHGWYLEGSSNFAFFDKTKVTRISFYAGKNLNRRLYARGGVRLGRDRMTLPLQMQYHAVVRQKLRFGIYGGPSLDVTSIGVKAELGLIAYYEVLPGWSLYVAPVILDNSQYKDRIFETGIRYYLDKKK